VKYSHTYSDCAVGSQNADRSNEYGNKELYKRHEKGEERFRSSE